MTQTATTTFCRGCDLAFCNEHKHLLDRVPTHGSHHAVEPESTVALCCVCMGIYKPPAE